MRRSITRTLLLAALTAVTLGGTALPASAQSCRSGRYWESDRSYRDSDYDRSYRYSRYSDYDDCGDRYSSDYYRRRAYWAHHPATVVERVVVVRPRRTVRYVSRVAGYRAAYRPCAVRRHRRTRVVRYTTVVYR